MWRPFASLLVTFVALAWGTVASAVCFFYTAALWRDLFGRSGAFYGAVAAFVVCIIIARLMLCVADRLLEPYSGPFDERAYRSAPRDSFYANWQRYAGEIIRDRRYAFYSRTRQWDKLAALEAETSRQRADGSPPSQAVTPQRTSVAGDLRPDEVARASRRTSARQARIERWAVLDEYEND